MPKLVNQPPKYAKSGKYACVCHNGKKISLGRHGSPESKIAYKRFLAEWSNPTLCPSKGEKDVTVKELAGTFLDHAKATLGSTNYSHYRTAIMEFLVELYGDIPVEEFKPSCLKAVRAQLIQARKKGKPRFCRIMINDYARRFVALFKWGVEEELVKPETWAALKIVKPLPEGYPGTFDNPEREDVSDDVIRRTLPFLPPILQTMIKIQRLLGCRPSEVFNMRVGEIDKDSDPELWLYRLSHHKMEKKSKRRRKKVLVLSKLEQELLMPYLEGKDPAAAVFSPNVAMQERNAEKRANRKSKPTPSQRAREKERAAKPSRYAEFYNKGSYRRAVLYAINKANRQLPDGEKLPQWTPYQIRHTAATMMELEVGFDEAQYLLDHASPDVTARYAHAQIQKKKELARNRRNPFDSVGQVESEN